MPPLSILSKTTNKF